jgi:hypothetical protein
MANRTDTFNRANSATSLGTPSDGGSAWVAAVGDWGINGNAAYCPDGDSPAIAWLESSATNFEVQVTMATYAQFCGLTFSWVDSSNYGRLLLSSAGKYELQIIVGGSEVVNLQWGVLEPVSGDVVKVRRNGSELKGYVNGTERFSTTSTALGSSTKHGLFGFGQSLGRYEDFTIVDLGGGGGTAVSFTGTIPTLNGTQGTSFAAQSPTIASYFSGSLTPFTYSIFSGTLPAGLSLNSSTGVISGTPTTAGTTTGLVIRATDASSNTANSNSFSIVIAPPAATAMTIALKQSDGTTPAASITGIEYAILNAATVAAATAVLDTGTGESTDGSGNLVLDLTGLGLTVGQVRYVVAGKSNGTAGANFDGWHGPATAA